jgi:Spy/CpxP family protein refolding chaperone
MKKYGMLALAFAFIYSLAVSAQDQMPPQPREGHQKEFKHDQKPKLTAQKRAGYLAVDLELTDAQRAKVQALFEKQDKIRTERQAEIKKMKEQEMAKFEAERKANDAEMEKILGAEKFQQFKAKQAERQEKMKEKMKKGHFRNQNGPHAGEKHGMRPEKEVAK